MKMISLRVASKLGAVCVPGVCLTAMALAATDGVATAAPIAAAGYTVTTFATAPSGSSAPDSLAVIGNDVYVGYGNGGNPDGSGGAVSTIAEFTSGGALVGTTSVVGHNDGLRYDASTGKLWALQNEDANPNLVLITPGTLAKSPVYGFSATAHGGGYDDIAFAGGRAFISASNPANNPNTGPAIVSGTISGGTVVVSNVFAGNATATSINTGHPVTLNLQDPDSMIFAPDGRLVLDSQADAELVFVSNPGAAGQAASVLALSNQVDDTVFSGTGQHTLLVADKHDNTVYEITGDFGPGGAFSAAAANPGQAGGDFVGSLDLATGNLTPIVSGLNGPGGEAFLPVPEPASFVLLAAGLAGLGLVRRPRRSCAR